MNEQFKEKKYINAYICMYINFGKPISKYEIKFKLNQLLRVRPLTIFGKNKQFLGY